MDDAHRPSPQSDWLQHYFKEGLNEALLDDQTAEFVAVMKMVGELREWDDDRVVRYLLEHCDLLPRWRAIDLAWDAMVKTLSADERAERADLIHFFDGSMRALGDALSRLERVSRAMSFLLYETPPAPERDAPLMPRHKAEPPPS